MMKLRISLLLAGMTFGFSAYCQTPEELANAQLEAYNKGDVEAFLVPFSDSVKVYNDKGALLYQGKETMRDQYSAGFERMPELHCKILNRIAVGNTVVDHEEVTFGQGRKVYAIVVYKMAKNKIQEVHFIANK